ncbi:MAG TPA: HAMP domain-containing sensor histidine kinase [Chryseosolibacter sp.]|nr:HAMP domain-containing sensor histidine kinase [Chryseosolibacter sp.]
MNSTRRIGLLLTLIFLLPALFFSVYEMSTLNKDEKMIQEIYQKQLDAILFSVNQYADDILSSWIARIEGHYDASLPTDSVPPKIQDVLNLNASLQYVFIIDTTAKEPMKIYTNNMYDENIRQHIEQTVSNHRTVIAELIRYKRSGFQKIMRIAWADKDARFTECLVYISGESQMKISGLLINTELFFEDLIGPKLQAVAQDQFILSVLQPASDSVVYTTATRNDTTSTAEALTKDLWILPDYSLGIRGKGTTMQELVRERTRSNLILLIGLDVILIIGVVLVFRNLKKEVDLAQNKADFVSNVSHEIRTPLALISMFAETLEMDRVPSEEKKREYYHIISKETQRLSGIVNKILNFSQTEANKKTLYPERLHVDTEIKNILDTYQFHLSNKGFAYTYEPVGDLYIKADKEAFTEIMINLIDNAMKYSDTVKKIDLSTRAEGTDVCIVIKDHGIGISKKDQKHIFDKFYRVPEGNLARKSGTGLGLSLVKQLMEAQGGRIMVSSEPGHGSEFRLYFESHNN